MTAIIMMKTMEIKKKRDTEELDDDVEEHSQRSEELQNVNEQIRFFEPSFNNTWK